jgi:CrcB protein
LARQQYGWVAAHLSLHLLGSIAMTGLGIFTVNLIRS